MKIRIVSYEDLDAWICGKIARRLTDALVELGYDCTVGKTVDLSADVNHHVIYLNYPGHETGVHTLMVTHVDDALKLQRLKVTMKTARAAIAVSADGVSQLATLGLDSSKLAYVNLAHDGNAVPRRTVIGITTRLYPDGRKREDFVERLIQEISPNDFTFKIMGFGWRPVVEKMRARGFVVEFFEDFHYKTYHQLLSTLDYFMYLGKDEGSMGFIDALASGVKTIVHPQGHHLDAVNGITHPVENYEQLRHAFAKIAAERHQLTGAVRDWTWMNYARKHVAIWERCLSGEDIGRAGSCLSCWDRWTATSRLWTNIFVRKGTMITNLGKEYECGSRWWSRKKR